MKKATYGAVGLLLIHLLASLYATRHLSPTWDEISYPFSGYVHLKTGSLEFYPNNPFLARLFYGVPLFFTANKPEPTFESLQQQDPAMAGYRYFYEKAENSLNAISASRWPAIFFSLLFGWILFKAAKAQWGEAGGLISLVAFLSTPVFLSRSSLALLEMPMMAAMLAALWFHGKNLESGRNTFLWLSAICSALAMLCKFAALPLIATIVLINLFSKKRMRHRIKAILVYFGVFFAVLIAGYAPWKGGLYALGVALADLFQFNQVVPFYWNGMVREHAPSLFSWAAFGVKFPLALLILFLWALLRKKLGFKPATSQFITLILVTFAEPLFLDQPVSTIQLAPIYIGVVFIVGSLGNIFNGTALWKKAALLGLLVLNVIDVYWTFPNTLSYFNLPSGGSRNGIRWLADSDQDWGQSLPALGSYLARTPQATVLLSYSGAGDPGAYGITYIDVVSPALVSKIHKNPPLPALDSKEPILLAVGTEVIQKNIGAFNWLVSHRAPSKVIENVFLVFDVTEDVEAMRWLNDVYQQMGNREAADWAFQKSERLKTLAS